MQLTTDRAFAAVDVPPELSYDRTGPGTAAGRYLRRFWTPIAESIEVKAGRAKPVQIMSERFTLYRGATGTVHLVGHLCPHRHVALSTGRVDGDCISCFYHGWKFDSTGQCVEQPAESEAFAAKVRVAAYPTREYLGLIYAYLGEGDPPEFPRFTHFERPGYLLARSYVRETNYFNSLENSADHVHAFFVHEKSEFTTLGVNREVPVIESEETDFGLQVLSKYANGKDAMFYMLMPLATYIMIAGMGVDKLVDHLAYRVPIDDNTHRSFIVNLIEVFGEEREKVVAFQRDQRAMMRDLPKQSEIVEAVIRGDMHIDEVPDRPDLVNIQDTVIMNTQPMISEREPDRLGRSDRAVILLRRMFAREIEASNAGRPLKRWTVPDALSAVPSV